MDRLWRERYNLFAAMRFLLDLKDAERAVSLTWALWRYWWVTGLLRESRRWMEEVLGGGSKDNLSPTRRAEACLVVGTMAWSEGEVERALPALEEALRLSRETGDARSQAVALMGLGYLDVEEREVARARGRFEESLRLFGVAGQKWGEALMLNYLGLPFLLEGEYEPARRCFEKGLATARVAGDRVAAHQALYNLGRLALSREDLDRASEHFAQGLSLADEVRDVLNAAYFVKGLGHVAGLRGQDALAVRLLGAAETALRAAGSGTYRYIPDRTLQDRVLAAAHDALGASAFDEEWNRGRALTLERIIAEVLGNSPRTASFGENDPDPAP